MFILQKLVPIDSAPALTSAVGHHAQFAIDNATGDTYLNQNATWSKIRNGDGTAVALPLNGAVTVQTQGGGRSRALTAVNGLVTLGSGDTIVANGDSVVLKKSDGTTTSAGNAGLNSPATAVVSSGALQNVKASA